MNIPIYRAKKIDSDEYIEGLFNGERKILIGKVGFQIVNGFMCDTFFGEQIDISTLSIHFPNMLASDSNRLLENGEKDLRIFASLNSKGNGGDMLHLGDDDNFIAIFDAINGVIPYYEDIDDYKIVGIKQ